jgi:hypothetical protein
MTPEQKEKRRVYLAAITKYINQKRKANNPKKPK